MKVNWYFTHFRSGMVNTVALLIALIVPAFPGIGWADVNETGILNLTIIDRTTGLETPARVEVLDKKGHSFIAENALLIGGDCGGFDKDTAPMQEPLDVALSKFTKSIESPFTGAEHFYSNGQSNLSLPEGVYNIKVLKGPEFYLGIMEIEIRAGEVRTEKIKLKRFANLPAKGWYGADDHLHIARTHKEVDPLVLKMMQAEDIHVGNTLQMGRSHSFSITPQHSHGPESYYQEGDHMIATGQENLRTHFLGHTITLGAKEPLLDTENYLIYRLFWEQAIKQGGINGYAHFGLSHMTSNGPALGLSLAAPHGFLHFMEVLQFNQANYDAWYDMLNLGFRITPTAGSDYPCVAPRLPGQERFYTRVDGEFTYQNWLEGVRLGRTFVTTGPLLELNINGRDIGDTIHLKQGGSLTVEGVLRYDPQKSLLSPYFMEGYTDPDKSFPAGLQLVVNGRVVRSFPRTDDSGIVKFTIELDVNEASWIALRTIDSLLSVYSSQRRHSTAHTAPIFVTVDGLPTLAEHPRTRDIAKTWLASLDALEQMFSDEKIAYLANFYTPGDPVSEDLVNNSQEIIQDELEVSRKFFTQFLNSNFKLK